METLPQLVALREKLIDATYSGVRSVRDSNGEEISWRSQSELNDALRKLNHEIQAREGELGCSRITFQTSKGL